MFDIKSAFRALNDTVFSPKELHKTLDKMRRDNFRLIPVSVDTKSFFRIGVEQHWIWKTKEGDYRIRVS